jgi:uncharacterized protein YbjT (DUF2867 family)
MGAASLVHRWSVGCSGRFPRSGTGPSQVARRAEGPEKVLGDVEDIDSLRRAITGCNALHISLRGGPRDADYERVEHRGTPSSRSCRRARQRAPQLSVPHARSPDSGSASLRAKWRAEHAIAASGVPHTIFRSVDDRPRADLESGWVQALAGGGDSGDNRAPRRLSGVPLTNGWHSGHQA